ncbi:MAG: ABC transporter ATP-binding protein [Chthoniobacterales bacterium]|nr:ABC transporter ATP-binding protein [Chthoniobacterales bacterium]
MDPSRVEKHPDSGASRHLQTLLSQPSTLNSAPPLLSVRGLRVLRGDTRILSEVTWTVRRGEHWAILGANGSGKTSLLAAITAYLTPSHGGIEVLGQSYGASDWQELRRHIGMVSSALTRHIPQDETAMDTVLSGETAQLGYWSRRKSAHAGLAKRCLSRMGVGRLADRPWGVLSQGERQKVFIARALMAHPRVLILDEPCAGLDPVARERFLRTLRRLASEKRGPALVFVTHHVEEIIPEITHVLVLRRGRTLAAGPAAKVLTAPVLSEAFGAPVKIRRDKSGGWTMRVAADRALPRDR